jgi:hypothetical protein
MFSASHDFVGVVFVFPKEEFSELTSLADILELFPKGKLSATKITPSGIEGAEIAHALYFSPAYYPRSDDDELRDSITVKRGKSTLYKYDIYFLCDGGADNLHCLVATPFSALGREVFLELHKASGNSRPRYRKVNLARLLGVLYNGKTEQSRITVRSLQIPINKQNVERLWLTGKDIVDSTAYDLLPKMLKVLGEDIHSSEKYKPESCQFAYEGQLGALFRLTVDLHGNYRFYLGRSKTVLDYLIHLLRFFKEQGATEDVMPWPWRGGAIPPVPGETEPPL